MAHQGARSDRARAVLFIVENLPVPFDRRVWQEATTLRAAGYQVAVICPVGKGCEERYQELDGIHIYRHPLPVEADGALAYPAEYATALFWEMVLAWRVLFRHGFDAIHACNPPDTIFLIGGLFKRLLGKRFIFDHHDLCPELYEAKFGRRDFFWRLMVRLERWTFRTADVVIATNQSYRAVAIERGGVDPSRVFVVRSGPKLDRLHILPPVPRHRHGRRFLIGYLGVMGVQEGIEYLLEAMLHLIRDQGRRDIHLALVGGGSHLAALQRRAEELGVAGHCTFYGRVPDQLLLEVLNTADVCVNPDTWNELNDKSTMNKIMEYMSLAKPIVQFDMTEGRYTAGDASLYARPNDALDLATKLAELLDDEERRRHMGALGRRRVEDELSWEHEAPNLLAAYEAAWATRPAMGWAARLGLGGR
ncbi:MAG TPA: glycosyltransferase family 4 protein [Azospirillaceae bacterium]|nr:glycosyltransferase family 4 protein [Azospirillaceae bacterium]